MSKGYTDRFWVGILGLLALGTLLFFALFFWKERILFTDMAFHTYVILQTKSLAIQNNRFGAAITQAFPLVAAKLHMPLQPLMKLYSCSFYVWYSLVFIIILFVLRVKEMALVLVIYLTLLVSYSFFWAQSEYPQGMVFLAFFFAALLHISRPEARSTAGYILTVLLMVTSLFCHPLILIPFACCVMYLFLNRQLSAKAFVWLLVSAVVVLGLKNILLPTGYESGKMAGLKNFVILFPDYITIPSTKFFIKQLFFDYAGYTLIIAMVSVYFLRSGKYLKLAWLAASLTAYTFLINVSYPDVEQSTYTQNMLLPLGFIAAMPFVFEVLPVLKPKVWVPLLALLIGFRLFMIYQSHQFFTDRVVYLQQILDKTKSYSGNKFYVANNKLSNETLGDSWALAYETLLLSSIPSPDSARTIELEEIIDAHADIRDSDFVFINRYWGWDARTLPKQYFNLKEGKYEKIEP